MSPQYETAQEIKQAHHVKDDAGNVQFEESLTLSVAELFYPVYKRYLEGEDFVEDLEDDLGQANISYPVEIYTSSAVGYGVFAGIGLALLTGLLAAAVFSTAISIPPLPSEATSVLGDEIVQTALGVLSLLSGPVVGLLIGTVAGVFGVLASILAAIYYPKYLASKRARHTDLVIGEAVGFMYSLSVGGTNQLQVFEAVANAEDAYGEVAVEFQRITHEMKYFNTDYQTAVENVAELTPSEELGAFLSDMLSVINSGGDMTAFLETQQEMLREKGQKKQEELLDTIELFGEMYMSLNVLPMGLLIVLVIISMMGTPQLAGLYITVYGVLPGLNIAFAIAIATIKKDEIGDGTLDTEGRVAAIGEDETKLRDMGIIDYYMDGNHGYFFEPVRSRELRYRIRQILTSPWEFFRNRPPYVLILTVPITVLLFPVLIGSGLASLNTRAFVTDPYVQTVMWVYVPIFLNLGPLAFFYEWRERTRAKITDTLTQDLQKLANANETGQPLLEAMLMTSQGKSSLLSTEFERLVKKTRFGTSLSAALVEFNNRYSIPRLARVVKLIQKAQEASSNITPVLKTASTTSQFQDDLEKERKQRTQMQVAVTGMTFLVFTGVIVMLEVYFIGTMLESLGSQDVPIGGFQDIEVTLISMLFFHAVTIQAICAGGISGYVMTGNILSALKYVVAYLLLGAVAWGALAM
jgi:flagellar protein FlaJ